MIYQGTIQRWADTKKVDAILDWPRPKTSTEVRSFIGLVRYISAFLPKLSEHTSALGDLITKEADKKFPPWTAVHQTAFESIKKLVISRECLTTIDLTLMPEYNIYVTMDASDKGTGALLSFGKTWETARPVAFESMSLKGAQLNYPVHEKEILAIIRALTKWCTDLLGVSFTVLMDHKTLENFNTQRDLSRRQARWMEFMSQYDAKIVYVKGEDNTVTDALSRVPNRGTGGDTKTTGMDYAYCQGDEDDVAGMIANELDFSPLGAVCALAERGPSLVCATFSITADKALLLQIKEGYKDDRWVQDTLVKAKGSVPGIQHANGLWYVGDRLIVPRAGNIREMLFRLAHNVLGHFGFDKTYAALRGSYYWPNMRRDLETAYVPGCAECQRNKASTSKPIGPLHSLPVPDQRGDSVAMDFVGPLPLDDGFDMILMLTDRLGSDVRLVPCQSNLTAEQLAVLFFNGWYCENGLPVDIVCDHDKLFVSAFWKALHVLTGTKIKMSTSYHPVTVSHWTQPVGLGEGPAIGTL